jgi:hypothetical protein
MGGSLHTQKEDFRRHGGGPGVRLWKRQQKKGSRIRKLTAPLRRKVEAKLRQMR